jgi:hypothetical protein
MSKLLKQWKVFSFGAVMAVGLFMASCEVEPVEETDTYTVKVVGGGKGYSVANYSTERTVSSFVEGDTVIVFAGDTPADADGFGYWTIAPASVRKVNEGELKSGEAFVVFVMPGANVTVTANWEYDDFIDGKAQVRFSWQDSARTSRGYDIVISASPTDVAYWYDEVYDAAGYVKEDATDVPLHDGNPKLPDSFYKSSEHNAKVGNKSKYFDTNGGKYTAICSVTDQFGIFDIVANYTITVDKATSSRDGKDKWFEIAFEIIDYIDYYNTNEGGPEDKGVFTDEYSTGDTPPRLKKSGTRKPFKTYTSKKVTEGGSIEVTYYVFHRDAR